MSFNHLYDMGNFGSREQYPKCAIYNKMNIRSAFAAVTKDKLSIFQMMQAYLLVVFVYDVLLDMHYRKCPVIVET